MILDKVNQRLVAIDPGHGFGTRGIAEIDVICTIISIVNYCIKHKKYPKPSIDAFLKGYFTIFENQLSKQRARIAIKQVLKKIRSRWQKKAFINKAGSFFYSYMLQRYLICYFRAHTSDKWA